MVTQRDIAQRAGVSQKTVSKALQGSGEVSEDAATFIRGLAEEMGYVPNPMVSSLMRSRRRSLDQPPRGHVIGWHGAVSALRRRDRGREDLCDTYAEMYSGAEEEARRNGFSLEVFPYIREQKFDLGRILKARGIRSLILGPMGPRRKREVDLEKLKGIYLVRLERDFQELHLDRVVQDAFQSMRECLTALLGQGVRRVGYMDTQGHQESSEDRWLGAFLSCRSLGLSLCKTQIKDLKKQDSVTSLISYLKREKPEGLVVGSRQYIRAAIEVLGDRPEIPFVCLERNAWPDWVSGVEAPFHEIGGEAVRLLMNRVLSPQQDIKVRRSVALQSTWHEGRSHLRSF